MLRNLVSVRPFVLAAFVLASLFCLPGHSQDKPSLGDLARQLQKEKDTTPAAKVLTNDDLSSGSDHAPSAFVQPGESKAPSKPATSTNPSEELARIELMINKIDSMDRPALMKTVLEGADSDFPGRAKWEQKMYAAKVAYVSQGRDLLQRAKGVQTSAQSLQASRNPDDPRVKDLTDTLKEIVRDGVRADAAFQAVILEGRDLASLSSPH
jgi:hypothetical protein